MAIVIFGIRTVLASFFGERRGFSPPLLLERTKDKYPQ